VQFFEIGAQLLQGFVGEHVRLLPRVYFDWAFVGAGGRSLFTVT
jgi:hypothetical protein